MLTFEHEPFDVGREVGMGLEPVPAGDQREHEAPSRPVVLLLELAAQLVNARHRQLHQLREQPGIDRLERGEHDRLDDAARFVTAEIVRGVQEVVGSQGTSSSRLLLGRLDGVPVVEAAEVEPVVARAPAHDQIVERPRLVDVDEPLLVELQQRQEAHDDLEPVGLPRRPTHGT